ncbi:Hypothetical predicted protein [Olea europaea subsp. europaea]|uniref:Uncharacterized protein n=1 Tax=Olea europaea subsp. europaea TaxID=158383 RepID=A0A8S0TTB8_OLEEU|nr:Hypothetical predicted protein [Olea europaea subsp. europaea]
MTTVGEDDDRGGQNRQRCCTLDTDNMTMIKMSFEGLTVAGFWDDNAGKNNSKSSKGNRQE